MTGQELVNNVLNNLNDSGIKFFTADAVMSSLQDGYDDLTCFCGQIEKSKKISFRDGTSYYDALTLIPDFLAVTAIYNYNTKLWLIDASSRELDQIRWDWENWAGEPKWYWPHDFRYIAVVPKQSVATGSMEVFYKATAPILTLTTTPLIKSEAVKALEFYATADLLLAVKEFTKFKFWRTQYLELRQRYKSDVKSLSEADRFLMIQQQDYPILV